MQEIINSDSDSKSTMLASQTFDNILEEIQKSCLNFQLQIFPFSAMISLKKSFIKDRSGNPLLPIKQLNNKSRQSKDYIEALVARNFELETKLNCLQIEHKNVVDECSDAYQIIRNFEKNHQEVVIKNEVAESSVTQNLEKEMLQEALKDRDSEILGLQRDKKVAKETIDKLNKALSDTRVKFQKEKEAILREHRAEVKAWKKDQGDARSKILKLEKEAIAKENNQQKFKQNNSRVKSNKKHVKTLDKKEYPSITLCSICALEISNFIPEYFCGEKYNPTCEKCKADDSSWNPDDPFSSFPSPTQPSSMVTHWISTDVKNTPLRPGSISSMISHCALLPPPGSYFISKEEVLEIMREIFKRPIFQKDKS